MRILTVLIGKIVLFVSKLKGGGSALPGLAVEKINPKFLAQVLSPLPFGVVVISGTNGKTTTTKIVTELLEAQNVKVFTNRSGSNFVRGVLAAIISEIDWRGKLNADIAVIELDEAHAQHFIEKVKPKYSLLLNAMRDQLDRFGEVDYTAQLLQKIGEATTEVSVINYGDPLLSSRKFSKKNHDARYFGFSKNLEKFFPQDIEGSRPHAVDTDKISAQLVNFSESNAEIILKKHHLNFTPSIKGAHNLINITAACGLIVEIFERENRVLDELRLADSLSKIEPAFGRGEVIELGDQKIEILLVKNPAGFRANLEREITPETDIMIAINDNYADGRDVSWLWDVDFSQLAGKKISAISGVRAYDMALRLVHDNIEINEKNINDNLVQSLNDFLMQSSQNKKIFATYTAMLKIREEILKRGSDE